MAKEPKGGSRRAQACPKIGVHDSGGAGGWGSIARLWESRSFCSWVLWRGWLSPWAQLGTWGWHAREPQRLCCSSESPCLLLLAQRWRSTHDFPGYSDRKWRQCPHHVSYASRCWGQAVPKLTRFRAGHEWLCFVFLLSPAEAKSISNARRGAQGNLPSWAMYRPTPNVGVWACMGCLTWLPKKASNLASKQHKQTNTIFLWSFVDELQVNSNTHDQLDSRV